LRSAIVTAIAKGAKGILTISDSVARLRIVASNTLDHLCEAVERASRPSPTEARGGRPRNSLRQEMVEMAVRVYFSVLGKIRNDKRGRFEKAIRICLQAAEFAPGKVHDLILAACKNTQTQGRRISATRDGNR